MWLKELHVAQRVHEWRLILQIFYSCPESLPRHTAHAVATGEDHSILKKDDRIRLMGTILLEINLTEYV